MEREPVGIDESELVDVEEGLDEGLVIIDKYGRWLTGEQAADLRQLRPRPSTLQQLTAAAVIAGFVGLLVLLGGLFFSGEDRSDERTSSPRQTVPDDLYEMLEVAFIGGPGRSELEPLFRHVLTGTGVAYSDREAERLADVLVVFRRESKIGVTETDILKCMARSVPIENVAYHELAALTSVLLETNQNVCL